MKRKRRGVPGVRATVIYGGRRGHGKKLWAYSYEEIALAAETSVGAVRQAYSAGEFNPADLSSLLAWVNRRVGEADDRE